MKGTWLEPIVWWALLAVPITLLLCGIYLGLQQNYRQNANDPQIQMVEDAVAALAGDAYIYSVMPVEKVDMTRSLAPFIVVYDKGGKPITGNGYLGQELLQVPKGVFDKASEWGQNRRTLEPAHGVRIASVVMPYTTLHESGYILAGRNLDEVESRVQALSLTLFVGWIFTLGATLVMSYIAWFVLRTRP
jgi:hypothetical protein